MKPRTVMATALCAIAAAFAPPSGSTASERCTDDAMIVFDGSGSMSEMGFNLLDEPRIFEARRALRSAMPHIAPLRRLGLIIYGPGPNDACSNIDLRFGPIANASERVIAEVDAMQPEGSTPLTEAVKHAAEVLDYRKEAGTVVLISDGKETCGGTPCALAETFVTDAASLTVHVIGFKVRHDRFKWGPIGSTQDTTAVSVARCLADRTGGKYVSAETVEELAAALRNTLGCQIIGMRDLNPLHDFG